MNFSKLLSLLFVLTIVNSPNAFAQAQTCAKNVKPACLLQEMEGLFEKTENETARDDIGGDLVQFLINTGKHKRALEVAEKLVDPYAQTSAITSIIQRLAQVGQMDEAVRVLKANLPETNDRLYALQSIGEYYIKDGNIDAAIGLGDLLSGEESLDNYYQNLISNLTYDSRYKQAYELTARLSLPQKRASALRTIAERQANAGY